MCTQAMRQKIAEYFKMQPVLKAWLLAPTPEGNSERFNVSTRESGSRSRTSSYTNAVQWDTFTKYLESKGKLRK